MLLSSLPERLALLYEGSNALARISVGHVPHHEFAGIFVGIGDGHLQLAIERLFAERQRVGRFRGDLRCQRLDRLLELLGRDHIVDQPMRSANAAS